MRNQPMCNLILSLPFRGVLSAFAAAVLLIVVVAPCAQSQSTKDADARAQATALFAKALAVSDIRAPGSPPFEMRATITVKQRFGKPETGSYLLEWASPEKWREEIHFANYTRIRVGGKNQYWQSRTTTSYEIGPISQLNNGLDFLKNLHVWSNPAAMAPFKGVKLRQNIAEGIKQDCVTLIPTEENRSPNDYCFHRALGTLVSNSADHIEFSDFIPFNGKYFPSTIAVEVPSIAQVTLQVSSIALLASADKADFQPPPGSTIWPSCDAPDALPIIKSQARPEYPVTEKMAYRQGSVFFYAVIGTDGRLSNLKLLEAPDSGLADSALMSLRQWKYSPETCSGTPVPVETVIQITYTLGF